MITERDGPYYCLAKTPTLCSANRNPIAMTKDAETKPTALTVLRIFVQQHIAQITTLVIFVRTVNLATRRLLENV